MNNIPDVLETISVKDSITDGRYATKHRRERGLRDGGASEKADGSKCIFFNGGKL